MFVSMFVLDVYVWSGSKVTFCFNQTMSVDPIWFSSALPETAFSTTYSITFALHVDIHYMSCVSCLFEILLVILNPNHTINDPILHACFLKQFTSKHKWG